MEGCIYLSIHIYIHIYRCIYIYIYKIYIHIYIYRSEACEVRNFLLRASRL